MDDNPAFITGLTFGWTAINDITTIAGNAKFASANSGEIFTHLRMYPLALRKSVKTFSIRDATDRPSAAAASLTAALVCSEARNTKGATFILGLVDFMLTASMPYA